MKQYRFLSLAALLAGVTIFSSCSDNDPEPAVIPPTESGIIEVDGGGAEYPNTAFIQLRTGTQTAVARESWDLAFAAGSDFKVLINGTTGAMASGKGETDIIAVSAADMTSTDSAAITYSVPNAVGISHVDEVSNPLAEPVITPISSTDSSNEVYILNRGSSAATERPWKKIRIIRNGEGYTLQHADADATTFTSVDIAKDSDLNFVYFSFENGIVIVEPAKTAWDIAWTASISSTNFGGGAIPYFYQDLVYHNIYGGSAAAKVLEEDVAYENFTEQDAENLAFSTTDRLTIGSSWRYTGGPPPSDPPHAFDTVYYVVKDAENNLYKVRFLSLTKDGERGKPSFEFELVEAK